MASFPTGVFAPTTKNPGDTIQPAHVNDGQDEIVAIENALLNSSLTLGGEKIFSQSPTLPRWPACKVTNSADQQVAGGAFAGLSWDTEAHDSASMHSTSANSSRVLLNSSGVWHIVAHVNWVGNATPNRFARIMLNDATALVGDVKAATSIDPYPQSLSVEYLATSTSNHVTLQVQPSGSSGRVYGTDATYGPSFLSAMRVSQ